MPKGHVIKGLNILKDGKDPVAKDKSEYPEWLWTVHLKRQDNIAEIGRLRREHIKKVNSLNKSK
jgi:large subunit ribosomal protein L54